MNSSELPSYITSQASLSKSAADTYAAYPNAIMPPLSGVPRLRRVWRTQILVFELATCLANGSDELASEVVPTQRFLEFEQCTVNRDSGYWIILTFQSTSIDLLIPSVYCPQVSTHDPEDRTMPTHSREFKVKDWEKYARDEEVEDIDMREEDRRERERPQERFVIGPNGEKRPISSLSSIVWAMEIGTGLRDEEYVDKKPPPKKRVRII